MTNDYSMEDLLDFLSHAGDRGMMPVATAKALAVASRNVFGVLEADEQKNINALDLDAILRRFNNKRARDFNPGSLKEYARRVRRAIELYEQWRDNPADFSIKTRTAVHKSKKNSESEPTQYAPNNSTDEVRLPLNRPGTFQSSFPVGPGRVVTLSNIPEDLTSAEAARLAKFVQMLSID